jgi:hypothetical protein
MTIMHCSRAALSETIPLIFGGASLLGVFVAEVTFMGWIWLQYA